MNNLNKIEGSRLLGLLNTNKRDNLISLLSEKDSEIDYLKKENSQLKAINAELTEKYEYNRETLFMLKNTIKADIPAKTNFKKGRSVAHVHS